MKICITLKDPDGVSDAIDRVIRESNPDLTGGTTEYMEKEEEIGEAISKWVKYREYITVEIDTEKAMAVVIPVGK